MKRILLLLTLSMLTCVICWAQKMTIVNFELSPNDISATTNPRLDANEDHCALIKVRLARYGADFDGNVIKPANYNSGEYWVYMTDGSKRLTVKFPPYLPVEVEFAHYGIESLEKYRTYKLEISLPDVVAGDDGTSYFSLSVVPNNASLTIDGKFTSLNSDGTLLMRLPRGEEHSYRLTATGYQPKEGHFILGTDTYTVDDTLVSTMATLLVRCETKDASIWVNNARRGAGEWSGSLLAGTYNVEVQKEGYISQRKTIVLQESASDTVSFPALTPMTGQLDVTYRPNGAEVWIDGKYKGTSPYRFLDIPVGAHKVEIRMKGYETATRTVNLKFNQIEPLTGTLTKATIPVGNDTMGNGAQEGGVTTDEQGQGQGEPTPPAFTNDDEHLSFYLEGKFQAGKMMGAGASVGAYIYDFNIEGTFLLGLSKSEEIGWLQTTQGSNSGYSYTYKPMFYGAKLGYRIPSESKFRVTPQVGIGVASISGAQVQKGSGTDPDATSCYAVPASVGVRLEYNITKNFGVSASPEFGFPVMKSDTYTKLSDLSSKVKGFGSGFNARVGVFVSF